MQHRTVVVIIPLISRGQEFRFVVEQSKAVPEQPALAPSVCTTDPRLRRCRPAWWCRTLQAASDSSTLTSRSSYDTCAVMATNHVVHTRHVSFTSFICEAMKSRYRTVRTARSHPAVYRSCRIFDISLTYSDIFQCLWFACDLWPYIWLWPLHGQC